MKTLVCLWIAIISVVASAADSTALTAKYLRCEYLENPHGIDTTKPRLSWQVESVQRGQSQSAYCVLVATGDDSQMAVTLDNELAGSLVIELLAMPTKGATSQFFWAGPNRGFNAMQQTKRPLAATKDVHSYLFAISDASPVNKIRFDPFANYDQYADKGEMLIESIAIYQLPESTTSVPETRATK